MLFNFGKCKCLYTGPGNTGMNYEIGGPILSKTMKEKYLGVTMNADMKVSEQCRIAATKGNQVLGMIRRNIECKENSLIVCVCIIYSYNNEGTIGYKNSNTNIIKNKNGLTD